MKAWGHVLYMSRANQAPNNSINNINNVPNVSVSPQVPALVQAAAVTVQSLRRETDLVLQATRQQQALQARSVADPSQDNLANAHDNFQTIDNVTYIPNHHHVNGSWN